jgi:hypothetical protein
MNHTPIKILLVCVYVAFLSEAHEPAVVLTTLLPYERRLAGKIKPAI